MINVRKILPWLLVILWMSLIFYLSHQPVAESNKLSKGITEKLVEVAEKDVLIDSAGAVVGIVVCNVVSNFKANLSKFAINN